MLFGIVLLIIAAVGGYKYYDKLVPPIEEFTQYYVNSAYGIAFEYPDTYTLLEEDTGTGERYRYTIVLVDKELHANLPQNGEGPPSITLEFFQNNLDQISIEDWVRGTAFSNFKLSLDGVLKPATVGNAPALSYAWDGLYPAESTVFAHKSNIIMASVTFLTPEDHIRDDFKNILSTVELR